MAIRATTAPPARALDGATARAHVVETVEQVIDVIVANQPRTRTAEALLNIFQQRTALAQLARFCAGRNWRAMSGAEQTHYIDAFSRYLAFVYAGYFREFTGDIENLRRAVSYMGEVDAGRKGILVRSEIIVPNAPPIGIDWLISDRIGRVAVSDLVVEGISLAVTQREIISAMFEKRSGRVDLVIADLESEAQ